MVNVKRYIRVLTMNIIHSKMSVKWLLACSCTVLFTSVDKHHIWTSLSVLCYLVFTILCHRCRLINKKQVK